MATYPWLEALASPVSAAFFARCYAGRTMQRKPRWQVEVSIPWAIRAAGR
jgi:hypothetical protein